MILLLVLQRTHQLVLSRKMTVCQGVSSDLSDLVRRLSLASWKARNRQIISQLVYLLAYTSFNMRILKQNIESFAECKKVTTRNKKELMNGRWVLMSPSEKHKCEEKQPRHTLREGRDRGALKAGCIFGKDYIMFCLERWYASSRAASTSTFTEYIQECWEKGKK